MRPEDFLGKDGSVASPATAGSPGKPIPNAAPTPLNLTSDGDSILTQSLEDQLLIDLSQVLSIADVNFTRFIPDTFGPRRN